MVRTLLVWLLLLIALPAQAGVVAVVDFERAVNETTEGKNAQERLDTMYSARKSEIDRMREDLQKDVEDYQARVMVLSDDARADSEKALLEKQQRFEATYLQYQQEMQQTYYKLLQGLDDKMRALTEQIAEEKSYAVVLDKAAVVYYGGDTVDMTDVLIQRYNAL